MAQERKHERYPLRHIEIPPATQKLYENFLNLLEEKLSTGCDRILICRQALRQIYTGVSDLRSITPTSTGIAWSDSIHYAHFDPRNAVLEAERYGDCDQEKFEQVKPLIWLWYLFDRSPAGMNIPLGFQLRHLLARYMFKSVGKNVKFFPYIEFAFAYNLEVGDDVVVHRWVNLDDRAGIQIGARSSLSDFVNIYSHSHDINEQDLVWNKKTIIEEDVRVTYHATVLAGSHIKRGAMIGAGAIVTGKTVPPGEVWLGLPAKHIRNKDYFMDAASGEKLNYDDLQDKHQ